MNTINPVGGVGNAGHPDYIPTPASGSTEENGYSFSEILTGVMQEEELELQTDFEPAAETAETAETETPPVQEPMINESPPASAKSNAPVRNFEYQASITDALREDAIRMSMMASSGLSGMPGELASMQSTGIEQMIMAAASTGQIDDNQIALFMLLMMMQTSSGGDSGILMQMMATMLTQMQSDTGVSSGYNQSNLSTVDRFAYGARIPGVTGTSSAEIPVNGWIAATPAIVSTEEYRDPNLYRAVVNQFMVESSERYQPRDGKTYCNIFMWDVTAAMGAEVSHYTDPATGEPRYRPNNEGAIAMNATRIDTWLANYGHNYGWREADAETAQYYANQGRPAVTTSGSNGHVQVVVPSNDGGYDPVRGVTIAQAGSHLTSYTYITNTYSASALRDQVRYWVHN